jgi:NAD(P)-dependent dehydrogenase (short-subunit alcohol dehydrogenase family)
MVRLDNKVAIVIGAAGGIGLACAELLAASGSKVALVDCRPLLRVIS